MTTKIFSLILLIASIRAHGQVMPAPGKIDTAAWSVSVEEKITKLNTRLDASTARILRWFGKFNQSITKRASELTGSASSMRTSQGAVLAESQSTSEFESSSWSLEGRLYSAGLDTLLTTCRFLSTMTEDANHTLHRIRAFSDKLRRAIALNDLLRKHFDELKQWCEKFGSLRRMKKYTKQAFYFAEQLKKFVTQAGTPGRLERNAICVLASNAAFLDFMRKYSLLASAFPLRGENTTGYGLSNLQSRAEVNQLIDQRLLVDGSKSKDVLNKNVELGYERLEEARRRHLNNPAGALDETQARFKPNSQKTKTFLQRLDFGGSISTQKANYYFPVRIDFGVSVGYKLNDQSTIGLGASYRLGLGYDWNHLRLTQAGEGLKGYVEWKIPSPWRGRSGGDLWFAGGYELNYLQPGNTEIGAWPFSHWEQSGLIGLSKVFEVHSKYFKKTKLMMLWDFLSYREFPRSPSILFRVGYNL